MIKNRENYAEFAKLVWNSDSAKVKRKVITQLRIFFILHPCRPGAH